MPWELINRNRKGWIDALRAIAILLVIYGHCVDSLPAYFVFTSPFKMPLFFAISGYVLCVKNDDGSYQRFFNQIINKVFVPWMVLGLLPSVIMIPFMGFKHVLTTFIKLLSGDVLWFMPCFFIGEILWYIINRVFTTLWRLAIVSFICFAVGYVLRKFDLLSFAMLNQAMTVQPFFFIGLLFRQNEKLFVSIKWGWIVFAVAVYIGLCVISMVIFPGKTLDVHLIRYYNIPFCLFLVFFSCLLLFTIFCKADFYSSIMSFIGQNTLVLYIWHGIAITALVKATSLIGWSIQTNWWSAFIKVVWACFACGLCSLLINRFFPEVVGKKRASMKND